MQMTTKIIRGSIKFTEEQKQWRERGKLHSILSKTDRICPSTVILLFFLTKKLKQSGIYRD